MAYLKNLPVTDLKIDKSFVLNLANNEDDQQIVQTIIGLAHSFGLHVLLKVQKIKERWSYLRSGTANTRKVISLVALRH